MARHRIVRSSLMLCVGLVLAVAAWAASASAIQAPRTFTLLEVSGPNSDQQLGDFTWDRPPAGGDRFGFHGALHRWNGSTKGPRVGYDQVIISLVTGFGDDFKKDAFGLVSAQAFLPGGTIAIEGYGTLRGQGPSRNTFPVIGGTGIYAGARGQVHVRDLPSGNSSLRFELMP